MIWVISTDSNDCRIYSYCRKPLSLTLEKEISHPELKLKKSEYLTSDKPGHFQARGEAHGAFVPRTDPKEVEIDRFALEIANELDAARKQQVYNKLIIIASPHMLGLLQQHLDKNVKALIASEINKDFMHLKDQEILTYLHENVFNLGVDL